MHLLHRTVLSLSDFEEDNGEESSGVIMCIREVTSALKMETCFFPEKMISTN